MSLNNDAWEKLFDKYNILNKIEEHGFFEIESKTINEFRQARLMAKFDHYSNLPPIFKKNHISILPISRSRYILGKFDLYQKVSYDKNMKSIEMYLPESIETINRNDLYSESVALNCAYAAGMIDDLLNEESIPTVSGRMSSGSFDFTVNSLIQGVHKIQVNNSQLEIDGGYESDNSFMIIEAKNEEVEDILIRQLYYPYRLWQSKINKPIYPTFFTFSNDIFSFFVYEFQDLNHYNSLKLIKQQNYILSHEEITLDDIFQILKNVKIVLEPNVPFPQADKFTRIIDFLSHLVDGEKDKETLVTTTTFNVVDRQVAYYTTAAIYLGLAEKITKNRRTIFKLTEKGRHIMSLPYKQKYLSLVKSILEHRVFNRVLREQFDNGGNPIGKKRIIEIMKEENLYNVGKDSTFERRASTIQWWIDWILNLQYI